MEAKLYGQNKGGMSINGIIKDYYAYAGENISAGDLVEYVNGVAGKTDYGESVDTQLINSTYAGLTISAVALDENRVFIAHSYSSYTNLYGMVVTIDGATITAGTDTELSWMTGSGSRISAVLLPNGNVFIAHASSNDGPSLYGIVCVIEGTTITAGTDKELDSSSYSADTISAILLNNNTVFIAHTYKKYHYLLGMIVTINGTTVTKETDTELSSNTNSADRISTVKLADNKIFIAHLYSNKVYGMVVSINGTTITTGTDTQIVDAYSDGVGISACALPNGNAFVAYTHYATTYRYSLGAVLCAISGTTITVGSTYWNAVANTGTRVSVLTLPNGNILLLHGYGTDHYLYGKVFTIDGTSVKSGSDIQLSTEKYTGYTISQCLLSNGTIFAAHSNSSSYYLNAQIFGIEEGTSAGYYKPTTNIIATDYETQVRKVTTGQFDGIAKTEGAGGDDTGHKDIVSIWTKE